MVRTILMWCCLLGSGLGLLPAQQLSKPVQFSLHKGLPGYGLRKKANPEMFQGNRKRSDYFEGWYFKMVSADSAHILSVIPGIALSEDGSAQHAFIQLIDGKTAATEYHRFPIEDFRFSRKEFAIEIGGNFFSADRLVLDIDRPEGRVKGEVRMSGQVPYPNRPVLDAGIMGWYRFVPYMECYHGVVSLTHGLQGTLTRNGIPYDFDGGKGYIEKDWGSSMPSAWIWMQSNHFENDSTSFMLSVAHVPWRKKSFTGFLGFFLHEGKLHRFATYTHAKLTLGPADADSLAITIRERKFSIELKAIRAQAGALAAPVKGSMDRRIMESIDAHILLTLRDRRGAVVYRGLSHVAGLEIVGDQSLLRPK
jgi:hypothetical protein